MNITPSSFTSLAIAACLALSGTINCGGGSTTTDPNPTPAAVNSTEPTPTTPPPATTPPPDVTPAATITTTAATFAPANVTIKPGETVRWMLQPIHNVVSGDNCTSDNDFTSGAVGAVTTFDHMFPTAGTFPFFCVVHCSVGMTGTVTVAP